MSVYINSVENNTNAPEGVVMIGTVTNNSRSSAIDSGTLIRGEHSKDITPIEIKTQSSQAGNLVVATVSSIAYYFLLNPTTVQMNWYGPNNTHSSIQYKVDDGKSYQIKVNKIGDVTGLTPNS